MCGTCGCGEEARGDDRASLGGLGSGGPRADALELEPPSAQELVSGDGRGRRLRLEASLLAKNDELAWDNRTWLATNDVVSVNLMGAPGAGKTALLERTVLALREEVPVSVMEGDQETARDALRIRETGAPVVQINTGAGCHLDASMVAAGLRRLSPPPASLMFVENVGNLVCPALFDLGEHLKVVVMSVTEGDDKPLKYPHMFRVADALVLNKVDLLPFVPFDLARCLDYAERIRPGLRSFRVSAATGEGFDAWLGWLRELTPRSESQEERRP